jgi:hypothetical protein
MERYAPPASELAPPADRPIEVAHSGYVSSNTCQACHPREYASWRRSYHSTMTQRATTDTVAGPIDGVVVHARGRPFALERRGKEVWVELDDPEFPAGAGASAGGGTPPVAARVHKQIVQTTGSHSEQFYWIASGNGRNLRLLPIMYRLLDERRWTSLDHCCISVPGSEQNLADGRWNVACVRCHATQALPGIVPGESAVDTRVAEFGISCEACHGPGAEHAERYRDPLRRYEQHVSEARDTAIVEPSKLGKERASEVCGQCHSVQGFLNATDRDEWFRSGSRYRPGDVLADSRRLETSGADHFWSDGVIRVAGREYNGLVESPCFQRGEMSCLSCHSLHGEHGDARALDDWADDQLRADMRGNAACTQCHADFADAAAIAAHTHHPASSAGSECMNCHMPYTTYGLLKAIRSHQISSPSVQQTLASGRPNACNQCHLDRSLAFAAEHLSSWYGIARPALDDDQSTLAAGVLWSLEGDAGLRALMAWSMGWDAARATSGSDWMTPLLVLLLQDRYAAVRSIAYRTLAREPDGAALARCDPAASPEELHAAAAPLVQAWKARTHTPAAPLLITERGQSDVAALKRLLARRNEQPVTLNE